MTYNEAYDKIIQAYFRDEIKPFDAEFCFCGTLCGNSSGWHGYTDFRKTNSRHMDYAGYTGSDFVKMETALLQEIKSGVYSNPNWENELFSGMCNALEVLKQIHRDRGEDVDSLPALTKRNLQTVRQ